MTKLKCTLIVGLAALNMFMAGCSQSGNVSSASGDCSLDKVEFVIKQICNEPAVKGISKWENEYADGILICTDHYDIYTTLLEPLMLKRLPGFMESANKAYQKILNQKLTTSTRMKIYLFADREQWDKFSEKYTGSMWSVYQKIKRGAYYLNGSCVTYNIGMNRTFSVLAHEGWHQFASKHFTYRLPSWIDEGLAMQFETFEKRLGWYEFLPARNLPRLGGLRLAIERNKLISLHELVGMNPGDVVATSSEDAVSGYYSQVYALVRFLREYNYGYYRQSFEEMLFGGLDGSWPMNSDGAEVLSNRNIPMTAFWNREFSPRLFEYYVGGDYANLQKEYLSYCLKLASQVRIKKAAD